MDVYSFYQSPDFDPTIPVFVLLKGQPAIDSGGVLWQVFSDVFYAMANNEGIKNAFNGDKNSKVPAFSNELVVNGLFEVLGKMIAHSLIQSEGVDDIELAEYIKRVTEAPADKLNVIAFESGFIRLLSEAGEIRILTADNKLNVRQSLMLHNILVKKKAILDQFRKGLSILGLLDEIQRKPEMFEECFVYQGIVSNDSVASSLHFPASEDKNAQRVFQLLQTFFKNCNADGLDDFLRFVTGTRCSAKSILPRRITVSCESTNSIFASTCLLELKFPNHFRI
ncbi:unnamed protein product [Porites evermanni]|uniref:Uncharacterized protein n=1 Tax=Porites evermanni TaxID=104178 RepID=A0ABN8QP44_9CNID|nr:unnamed protein product [Porites evermanni]